MKLKVQQSQKKRKEKRKVNVKSKLHFRSAPSTAGMEELTQDFMTKLNYMDTTSTDQPYFNNPPYAYQSEVEDPSTSSSSTISSPPSPQTPQTPKRYTQQWQNELVQPDPDPHQRLSLSRDRNRRRPSIFSTAKSKATKPLQHNQIQKLNHGAGQQYQVKANPAIGTASNTSAGVKKRRNTHVKTTGRQLDFEKVMQTFMQHDQGLDDRQKYSNRQGKIYREPGPGKLETVRPQPSRPPVNRALSVEVPSFLQLQMHTTSEQPQVNVKDLNLNFNTQINPRTSSFQSSSFQMQISTFMNSLSAALEVVFVFVFVLAVVTLAILRCRKTAKRSIKKQPKTKCSFTQKQNSTLTSLELDLIERL